MGMSASQARLLYLTAQLNNLSLKGQNVSDAKARLALDTQAIQEKYIRALNSSRLFMNNNIFTTDGSVKESEYISIENLAASGYKVSDGSKILGYKWERVPTGETETIKYGFQMVPNISTQVINKSFSESNDEAEGNIQKMQNILDKLGLSKDDLDICSYSTAINSQDKVLNSILIKSQAGFNALFNAMQNSSDDELKSDLLEQNYVFDVENIDLSEFENLTINNFKGIFDGNGVTLSGLNPSNKLFDDLEGILKNINITTSDNENDLSINDFVSFDDNNYGIIDNSDIEAQGVSTKQQMQAQWVKVPKYENVLVEDPDFKITSLELEEGLRSGAYTLVKEAQKSSTTTILLNGVYYDTVALSCCSAITDEAEDKLIKKAEAEYNKDMQEIQMQDKRYEMDQKKIDTQYDALTKEEESLKTVLKQNAERSYKTFS